LKVGAERSFRAGPEMKGDKKSIDQCASICSDYTYFALQAGENGRGFCSCENDASRIGMFGKKDDCP
jgi:hypothetical protein